MKHLLALVLLPLPLLTHASEDRDYLQQLYRHFHSNPELSFHEIATAARLAQELRTAGFTITENVGGTGVVAVLANGPGPTVMLRADMDALPITEQTKLPYASQVSAVDDQGNTVGVMHACGHDVHMTSLVGAARELNRRRSEWSGTLVLIGQPAEERGAGARAMLADGLYERFPRPDFAVALHVAATLPTGVVAFTPGPALASVDSVDITVRGVGGHGAYPHDTRDPIVLASQIVLALQTIVSREIAPNEPAVVTVGSIHGGTKHNIIPAEVKLQLTVRSYSQPVRDQILAAIERISTGLARAAGMPDSALPEVKVLGENTPATINDPALTQRLMAALGAELGEQRVVETGPVMGGEDFSRYSMTAERVPAVIFWLGAVPAAQVENAPSTLPPLHSSLFAPVPDTTVLTGVRALVAGALTLLD